jgi:hypothetical protein
MKTRENSRRKLHFFGKKMRENRSGAAQGERDADLKPVGLSSRRVT